MKAKVIVNSRKPDFERLLNEFFENLSFKYEVKDIQYCMSQSLDPEGIAIDVTYSALILYKEKP